MNLPAQVERRISRRAFLGGLGVGVAGAWGVSAGLARLGDDPARPPQLYEYFLDNFWFKAADLEDQAITPPLKGAHKADIAIIGGGFPLRRRLQRRGRHVCTDRRSHHRRTHGGRGVRADQAIRRQSRNAVPGAEQHPHCVRAAVQVVPHAPRHKNGAMSASVLVHHARRFVRKARH